MVELVCVIAAVKSARIEVQGCRVLASIYFRAPPPDHIILDVLRLSEPAIINNIVKLHFPDGVRLSAHEHAVGPLRATPTAPLSHRESSHGVVAG
jgi:hypothetical protein